ncbi:DUF4365 domain-containing protein [Paenibacillus anseongense]|uniref:DUF4365 domain-containing protein n=1 Tax=Paenibacillus anseongense TaxID=2682845 RepID=UPI002DB8A59A|nr:DUF4365 domain-containing protein [Paenibacillus anseongense]MEC0270124.1 DUF4365 domain-containing protein [Paenibacillus anseongense]
MAHRKRRPFQHIMADNSIKQIKEYLPDEWVIREYNPDYGIDLVVEIFDYVDPEREMCEALGEMFFAQVKSVRKSNISKINVHPRRNVEKGPLKEDRDETKEIEVIKFKLETDEILTINSMGAGVPVFLILVCLDTRRVFYVCLNDWIEKVLVPEDPNYLDKQTKIINIPVRNELTHDPLSHNMFRFFAKRMKFYSAFNKFTYQQNELIYFFENAVDRERDLEDYSDILDYLYKTLHFITIIKRYDIWAAGNLWGILTIFQVELNELEKKIKNAFKIIISSLESEKIFEIPERLFDFQWTPPLLITEIQRFWDKLVNIANTYEEICREWNLPTHMGDELT